MRQIEEIVKRGRRKRKAKEIVRGARRKNLSETVQKWRRKDTADIINNEECGRKSHPLRRVKKR